MDEQALERGHGSRLAMAGAMNGRTLDPAAQKMMQGFGSAVLGGQDSDAKNFGHAGEVGALVIAVQSGDASQMNLTRQSMGPMQAVTPIISLGDEAFFNSNSMMFVRKGDKVLRIVYTGCPCATKDVVPLARQILGPFNLVGAIWLGSGAHTSSTKRAGLHPA